MKKEDLHVAVSAAIGQHIHAGDIVSDYHGMVEKVVASVQRLLPPIDNEASFDQLLHSPGELAQEDARLYGMGFVVDGQRVVPHRVRFFTNTEQKPAQALEIKIDTSDLMRIIRDENELRNALVADGWTPPA